MTPHPVDQKGHLYGFISTREALRASVVEMTDLVEQACAMQGTSATASVALGRALVGSVLLASQLKDRQALALQISGEGPLKRVFAHAQHEGLCRGSVSDKQAPLHFDDQGLALAALIGEGHLQVTTYIPHQKAPHVSQVPLQTGEIGEDLAHYLHQSKQIPCLLSLGVKLDKDGKVCAAGGVLIELMPGHSEDLLSRIEVQQEQAQSLSHLIESGETPLNLLRNHLGDIEVQQIKDHPVRYACTCSRDKAAQSLHLLESQDFDEILAAPESLNVDCDMCGLTYSFSHSDVQDIYKLSGKAPLH